MSMRETFVMVVFSDRNIMTAHLPYPSENGSNLFDRVEGFEIEVKYFIFNACEVFMVQIE